MVVRPSALVGLLLMTVSCAGTVPCQGADCACSSDDQCLLVPCWVEELNGPEDCAAPCTHDNLTPMSRSGYRQFMSEREEICDSPCLVSCSLSDQDYLQAKCSFGTCVGVSGSNPFD